MLGTPLNIAPRQPTVRAKSSGWPSMLKAMSPSTLRLKPVAVTMTSASSTWPDCRRMPSRSKLSIWSVTTEALPSRTHLNRSASGTKAMRCCHGR